MNRREPNEGHTPRQLEQILAINTAQTILQQIRTVLQITGYERLPATPATTLLWDRLLPLQKELPQLIQTIEREIELQDQQFGLSVPPSTPEASD